MSLSFREVQAASNMAELLYRFLPGSGYQKWKGHVSFVSVADELGIGNFWQAGSKTRAIANLLEKTLEFRRDLFEKLIIRIVREGIKYCDKKGEPITAKEIETLNGLILEVGFKFPELWDESFLNFLRADPETRSRQRVQTERLQERIRSEQKVTYQERIQTLSQNFLSIYQMDDRQQAGCDFERFLNELFEVEGLTPREPFTINSQLEQIDGSFSLDNETYLVEAKWHRDRIGREPLSAFRDVIIGKSHITRGVFISISGCTPNAIEALTRGKQPVFFVLDGYHLTVVLQGATSLEKLLRCYVRRFAEEGSMYISAQELL